MEKSIAFMFDLAGTLNDVTSSQAESLIERIEQLRIKFNADKAYISISTLFDNAKEIKYVCNVLKDHLTDNIVFGKHFYQDGMYDYESDHVELIEYYFNGDKFKTFYDYYVTKNGNNQFVALFDDSFDTLKYLEYQTKHPLFCGIPYSLKPRSKKINNMMCITSEIHGTNSIIDMLDQYIEKTKNIPATSILEAQKEIELSLERNETEYLISQCSFDTLANFINSKYITNTNYANILTDIKRALETQNYTDDEIEYLNIIMDKILEHFENIKNEYAIETVKSLQENIRKRKVDNKNHC